MASFTRKAIMEAFVVLLNEKPLNKITIKDIVEACGINRNTFYYHFQDVPDLIEAIVKEEIDAIIEKNASVASYEDSLNIAIEFILKNRRATLHMYNSANRDIYERYLMQLCQYLVETFMNTAFGNRKISDFDRGVIVRSYKCHCFGLFIDWLEGGLKDDFPRRMDRLCHLRKGLIEETFRRSQEELTARNGGIA